MAGPIAVLIQHTLALAIVDFFPIYQIPEKIDHSTVIDHPPPFYLSHDYSQMSMAFSHFVEILSYIGPWEYPECH